jgi:UDP-N-acetylglucosamine 2-epimerase (non-hydrolysing)
LFGEFNLPDLIKGIMKILHVVGARPNFMKIAPILRQMATEPDQFEQLLVHTGQHYDKNMSQVFFDELELPRPDINLQVGSASHARQTAHVMLSFEGVVRDFEPDWLFVPGDVNSTLACGLVGSKLGIQVAHVEAGLRSYDRTMPEEINRVVTDHLSDLLLTPSVDADENLLKEGIDPVRIRRVGNVMIDTLVRLLPKAEARWLDLRQRYTLNRFVLVTLHRPSNVDRLDSLRKIMAALADLSQKVPVLFPMHPRTRSRLVEDGWEQDSHNHLKLLEPLGYLDFLALQQQATLVLTDSGGVQEESSYLGVPCLTLRPNTERPVTITYGTNRLLNPEHYSARQITEAALETVHRPPSSQHTIPLWDGKAAGRIVEVIQELATG